MGDSDKTMMDTYVDERDYELLEADRYTFFVLKRIMGGECKLLLSDHERLILCLQDIRFRSGSGQRMMHRERKWKGPISWPKKTSY